MGFFLWRDHNSQKALTEKKEYFDRWIVTAKELNERFSNSSNGKSFLYLGFFEWITQIWVFRKT